jgi:ArsR family transcriptional regulator
MHDKYYHSALIAKALGHPTRLHILEVLRDGEACVCHLEAVIGRRQAYISQQLGYLREWGLVTIRRDRTNIYYSLADESIPRLIDAVRRSTRAIFGEEPATALTNRPVDCPCPHCREERQPIAESSLL